MGLFKGMKDMKDMVAAAPGMVESAQQMGANAQVMQQQQAVALQAAHTAAGQAEWQQQRARLKAFDTLSERHRAREARHNLKQEQKLQDEFAARIKDDEQTP